MSSRTRTDASSTSGVSLPMMTVFTGPIAGNVSVMPSDWKRTTLSVSIGWNTPHAPCQGSVLSSYLRPSNFKPSTYVCIQSLRSLMSLPKSSTKSSPSDCKSDSSMNSAKFASNSSSVSASGRRTISMPSAPILTSSGFSISISKSGSASADKPCGAW